ncbi:MAG: hypothetical protein KC643_29565 [Nitrospira sp.]|nr:hypothetical protein [Nitrospira sp.]
MSAGHMRNPKLLVSVFNAQEAREAIAGGGRIIDSEDPRSALGNIKPRQIMAISDAVLNYKRDFDVQLSTNIGEDQLLFDRSARGIAIQKSPYEIAGKAAQAAIGVSCAMGTQVHPCNWVKVGVDGMEVELVTQVLSEVVHTLKRTEQYRHCQVMSVLFAQDMGHWNTRKSHPSVREVLVGLREFYQVDSKDPDGFDLKDYAVGTLRDDSNRPYFAKKEEVTLEVLVQLGILGEGSKSSFVRLNELFPHSQFFPGIEEGQGKTTQAVIKAMVDATAEAGADGIMLDTRIQSKVARICLVDTSSEGLIDLNPYDKSNGLSRQGILSLEDLKFFVDYCHFKGVIANIAGSVQSYQAQQLWVQIPDADHLSTRGGSSAVPFDPSIGKDAGTNTRQFRVIKRSLVRGLAPPEHGGVLNIPKKINDDKQARERMHELIAGLSQKRQEMGLPKLESFLVESYGNQERIE